MDREHDPATREILREVHLLITNWAEGRLTDDEVARLEQLLRSSQQARDIYFDYIEDSVLLGTLASRPDESGPFVVSQPFVYDLIDELDAEQEQLRQAEEAARLQALREQQQSTPRAPAVRKPSPALFIVPVWSAIAAGLALAIWMTSGTNDEVVQQGVEPAGPLPPTQVATISSYVGPDSIGYWDSAAEQAQISAKVGTRLQVGKYALPKGIIELRFDSGPLAVVQGPAEFELWSKNGMELSLGKVVTRVPPVAKGFAVSTRSASIIDLGTEFAVAADDAGATEILVLDGRVSLKARPAADETRGPGAPGDEATTPAEATPYESLLTAGNARKVDTDRTVTVIENPNRSQFLRSLDGLVAVDDFQTAGGADPLAGGIGFLDDWQLDRQGIAVQDGMVEYAGNGDARMHRVFPSIDATSKPVYFSGEFRISGDDPVCSCWLVLSSRTDPYRSAIIGLTDGQFAVRLGDTSSDEAKAKGAVDKFAPGRWHFLVGRLRVDASGQLDELAIWVDPAVEVPGDPDKVLVDDLGYGDIDTLSLMFWDFGDAGAGQGCIDNVRVGTSWEAVQ